MNLTAYKALLNISRYWRVRDVFWLLKVYECEYDQLCYMGFWTTPHKMEKEMGSDYSNMYATFVSVKFYGGPRRTDEHYGNLAMYAVDRVLKRWSINMVGWQWLLKYKPLFTESMENQLNEIKPYFHSPLYPIYTSMYTCDEQEAHLEPVVTMNDREADDIGYMDGERIMEYVEIRGELVPILESGRQGQVTKPLAGTGGGTVFHWSSSGRVGVCGLTSQFPGLDNGMSPF